LAEQARPALVPISTNQPDIPPPDAGFVVGLWRHRLQLGDEQELRSKIWDFRTLTQLLHIVQIPPQYQAIAQVIRAPFVRDTWLRVTAALTQNEPVPHAEGRDDTSDSRRAAEIAQRWVRAAMSQMQRPDNTDPIVYGAMKALIRDSESVIKVVHRPDAYADFPKRMDDEGAEKYLARTQSWKKTKRRSPSSKSIVLPFAWRVVDRLQMIFGEGEFGDTWCLEYGEYPKSHLALLYGMTPTTDGGLIPPEYFFGGSPKPEGYQSSPSGLARKWEYWDAQWWCVVVDGYIAPGWPKPNPYAPHLPYFRAKIEEHPLEPLRYLAPGLDALLTMKMNWAYLSAYPNPVIQTIPNANVPNLDLPVGESDEPGQVTWVPGKIIEMPNGKQISFLSPPPVGQDLNQMTEILQGLIEVAGIPTIMRGSAGSDFSGYLANQMLAAANLTYKVLATVGARQLERVGKFLWWLVENRIHDTVYVLEEAGDVEAGNAKKWLGLRPTGKVSATEAPIDMLADLNVTFRPMLPTDEQARTMVALQGMNGGLFSQRYALEKIVQVDDPDQIMDDQWVEETLKTDPTLHEKTVTEALQRAGLGPPTQVPQLLGPNGQPLAPSGGGQQTPTGYPPGTAAGGMPAVPGVNQPMTPQAPIRPRKPAPGQGGPGGRPPGTFPGQPGGPNR
jgi:hypothetical protein